MTSSSPTAECLQLATDAVCEVCGVGCGSTFFLLCRNVTNCGNGRHIFCIADRESDISENPPGDAEEVPFLCACCVASADVPQPKKKPPVAQDDEIEDVPIMLQHRRRVSGHVATSSGGLPGASYKLPPAASKPDAGLGQEPLLAPMPQQPPATTLGAPPCNEDAAGQSVQPLELHRTPSVTGAGVTGSAGRLTQVAKSCHLRPGGKRVQQTNDMLAKNKRPKLAHVGSKPPQWPTLAASGAHDDYGAFDDLTSPMKATKPQEANVALQPKDAHIHPLASSHDTVPLSNAFGVANVGPSVQGSYAVERITSHHGNAPDPATHGLGAIGRPVATGGRTTGRALMTAMGRGFRPPIAKGHMMLGERLPSWTSKTGGRGFDLSSMVNLGSRGSGQASGLPHSSSLKAPANAEGQTPLPMASSIPASISVDASGDGGEHQLHIAAQQGEAINVLWQGKVQLKWGIGQQEASQVVALKARAAHPHQSLQGLSTLLSGVQSATLGAPSPHIVGTKVMPKALMPASIQAAWDFYTTNDPCDQSVVFETRYAIGGAYEFAKNTMSWFQNHKDYGLCMELNATTAELDPCTLRVLSGLPSASSDTIGDSPLRLYLVSMPSSGSTLRLLCLTGSRKHVHILSSWDKARTAKSIFLGGVNTSQRHGLKIRFSAYEEVGEDRPTSSIRKSVSKEDSMHERQLLAAARQLKAHPSDVTLLGAPINKQQDQGLTLKDILGHKGEDVEEDEDEGADAPPSSPGDGAIGSSGDDMDIDDEGGPLMTSTNVLHHVNPKLEPRDKDLGRDASPAPTNVEPPTALGSMPHDVSYIAKDVNVEADSSLPGADGVAHAPSSLEPSMSIDPMPRDWSVLSKAVMAEVDMAFHNVQEMHPTREQGGVQPSRNNKDEVANDENVVHIRWGKSRGLPLLQYAILPEAKCPQLRAQITGMMTGLAAIRCSTLKGLKLWIVADADELASMANNVQVATSIFGVECTTQQKLGDDINRVQVVALSNAKLSQLSGNVDIAMKAFALHHVVFLRAEPLMSAIASHAAALPPVVATKSVTLGDVLQATNESIELWPLGACIVLDAKAVVEADTGALQQLTGLLQHVRDGAGNHATWEVRMRSSDLDDIRSTGSPAHCAWLDRALTRDPAQQQGRYQSAVAASPLIVPLRPEEESSSSSTAVPAMVRDALRLMHAFRPARFCVATYSDAEGQEPGGVREKGRQAKDILAGSVEEVVAFLWLLSGLA